MSNKDKIYLSQAQLETLASGGTVSGYTGNEDTLYLVPQTSPVISGSGAPTSSTAAKYAGQLYIDTANNKTYQCTVIDTTTTPATYTWVKLIRATDITYLTGTFTVETTDWVSDVATVAVSGIQTTDTLNISGATAADVTNIINADLFITISAADTITITAQTTPTADITFAYSVFGIH